MTDAARLARPGELGSNGHRVNWSPVTILNWNFFKLYIVTLHNITVLQYNHTVAIILLPARCWISRTGISAVHSINSTPSPLFLAVGMSPLLLRLTRPRSVSGQASDD